MTLFPCVRGSDRGVVFRSVVLSREPVRGVSYVAYPDSDGQRNGEEVNTIPTQIDQRLVENNDSLAATLNAISISPPRDGFLSCNTAKGEHLNGASLGLAVAVEMCRPGQFPDVAFTGLVSSLSPHDCTFKVHDVDCVPEKIRGAIAAGVPLVFPFSDRVYPLVREHDALTPRDLTELTHEELSDPTRAKKIGTAYSLLEALNVARYLKPALRSRKVARD